MKYSFLALGTALFLFSSCGASKKLEQANTELGQIKEANAQQAQKLTAYEADIKKLKEENIVYGKEAEACRLVEQNLRAKNKNLIRNSQTEVPHCKTLRIKLQKRLPICGMQAAK